MLKTRKLLSCLLIFLLLSSVLGLSVYAMEEKAAENVGFEVDGTQYDFENGVTVSEESALSGEDSAYEYLGNYEDNMQNDPDFKTHSKEAVKTVREGVSAYATVWSLLPAVIAIALALITKEVYSSLFVGILAGGLIWSGFDFEKTVTHVFSDGFISSAALDKDSDI